MRKGDWLQTYQGGQMYPLDPCASEIDILDIAHALGNLCRFNGHVKKFYSVAEHSCHVSDLLPEKSLKLAGLLHDASEAYLCDMPRPIQRSNGFAQEYLKAEESLMRCIADKFGITWPLPSAIHHADNQLLATEALQLMSPLHPEWRDRFDPVDGLTLPCWTPEKATNQFVRRYFELTKEI